MTRSEKLEQAIDLFGVAAKMGKGVDVNSLGTEFILPILLAEQKRAAGCPVCRGETGIGGGMRIIDRTIECDSPDSYYRDSTSDEIHFCTECGRDLTEGESV